MYNNSIQLRTVNSICLSPPSYSAYVKWFKEKHRQKKVPLTERFSEWNISDRTENEYKDREEEVQLGYMKMSKEL